MARLEELTPGASVRGILPDSLVTVIATDWYGGDALKLTYKDAKGGLGDRILYRTDESTFDIAVAGRQWSFDGDGALYRLVSEAQRIRLAHLFDPLLAVHTSMVMPLPHQITAVYESMLPRQPLRFLLADDPGAGKTIMAGLLIKELIARGDLHRCLIVCPGSLAEQWQDELHDKFNLPFDILTNDKLEASRTGNWFLENNLVIARLDKLSRNEELQDKLEAPDAGWDLVVCDEAHKMSASLFGQEIKYTKRYNLGAKLSRLTRNFLLMTATPHNGKEADFQLFMALLDGDRFEGRYRGEGVHTVDVSDLMRRVVKEDLLKFDGTPLFPDRIAYALPFKLSKPEADLYQAVTEYVRDEFNRADALDNTKRAGTVGFALTILQRRLASSPEAIYQSLKRRRERLESRQKELELLNRGGQVAAPTYTGPVLDDTEIEDLEDAPDDELEAAEEEVLDQATAARTIAELKTEIETLRRLEAMAQVVRKSGTDTKWMELSALVGDIFRSTGGPVTVGERPMPRGSGAIEKPEASPRQKLVIFTEHRDTLNYLHDRIVRQCGRSSAVVLIHGGVAREDRLNAQEAFRHNPDVQVLLATDAAGEGINLQRAHLMVNYDLPWNPNRLEQRFGRIHRIGQTKVCHLWNLIAQETREGDVYLKLLEKLEAARAALGGQVFDVLGKVQFEGKPLRDLMIDAVRYGDQPEVQAKLTTVVEGALDKAQLQALIEDRALAHDSMDVSRVRKIREDMERAEARRLQPHYVESFFLEAFKQLGGTAKEREGRRYQVSRVPGVIRHRDRIIGSRYAVQPQYERITFEKSLVSPVDQALAAFICPGHPLLDATIDVTLERHRDLLRRGTILVDERDPGTSPRVLFTVEHAVEDARMADGGRRRVISRQLLYVEIDQAGNARHVQYAPYLDYRPLKEGDPTPEQVLARSECSWISASLEKTAEVHAITHMVPHHLAEVRDLRLALIAKTEAAVKDRLTKEINHWDHRAQQLKAQEQAGKSPSLNSSEARKRADQLQDRLQKRLADLKLEAQISAQPPVVLGGLLVIPSGLLTQMTGKKPEPTVPTDTLRWSALARAAVMDAEKKLGYEPVDRELEKLGYDIESRDPSTGHLRFIEVKGRAAGSATITVTKNEILYSLNKPDDFILAIVEFGEGEKHRIGYVRNPFKREPDFGVTSVNYDMQELMRRATEPAATVFEKRLD